MTQLSLSAAAKAAGISRSTLHDHIKTGKISAHISGQGRRAVDTSELLRVYGALQVIPDSSVVQSAGHFRTVPDTPAGQELSGRVAVLEAEKRGLQDLLHEKDARIEELRHTVRLLEFKPASPAVPVSCPEPDTKPARTAVKSDRTPTIVAGAILALVVLALVLQALSVIRLH